MLRYNRTVNLVFQGPPPFQTPAWICSGIESGIWSKRTSLAALWLQKWGGRWRARAVLSPDTLACPSTSRLLPQESQCETGTWWLGKVLALRFHQFSCNTEDASFISGLSDLRPCSPNSRSAECSDGKIMPEYRKLSITLSILQNQAHDKSKWTLKISGPFILLHLNFLVCQMWVIMLLHLKNDCTNTSVKCKWEELLIPFGGEVRQCTASRARGHAFQQQKKTNYWIVAYQRRAIYIHTEWSRNK